jgi:tetratricopeptide (TPR) repeat protein
LKSRKHPSRLIFARSFFSLVLATVFGSAFSQTRPNLNKELEEARKQVAATPDSAVHWHVLGVYEVAAGHADKAEEAFSKEVDVADKNLPTGLEETTVPGSKLYEALNLQKTAISLTSGKAAALNNRAAARYLLGHYAESMSDLDQAATTEPNWGVPWVNGALANVELGNYEQAERSARMAISLGEKSYRVYTTLAEIEIHSGLAERANDDLRVALQDDPEYPFALLVASQIRQRQGRGRESERALIQALKSGPTVATDSRFISRAGDGNAIGGGVGESHVRLFQVGLQPGRQGYRFSLQDDRQNVEARSNADQKLTFADLVYSGDIGTIYLTHRMSGGGRPGAVDSVVGIAPNPEARFGFSQTQALFLKTFSLSDRAELWLHGTYRASDVSLKTTTAGSWNYPLRDQQLLAETRLDLQHGSGRQTTLGVALSQLKRRGSGRRPIEPAEQVMPFGTTTAWTAYALHTMPIIGSVDLTFGAMAGGAAGNDQIQPVLDLGFKTGGQRAIHFRITPRFNDSVSNLVPFDLVADTPQKALVDRQDWTTCLYDRYAAISGVRTKLINFELSLNDNENAHLRTETVLFHRDMSDINVQGADPRVATNLLFTPVSSGKALGLEERVRIDLRQGLALRLVGTAQTTTAHLTNPTYDASAYPSLNPVALNEMPNFPRLQGTARLEYSSGEWFGGFEFNYVGNRKAVLPGTSSGNDITYVVRAPATAGVHFFLNRKIGRYANATFMLFNLGRANFYPGYPGATTGVLGIEYKF